MAALQAAHWNNQAEALTGFQFCENPLTEMKTSWNVLCFGILEK
jgi:hypothetical protein